MSFLKKTKLISTIVATLTLSLSATEYNTAIFADEHDPDNRILSVNYSDMTLIDENPIEGSLNHHADVIGTVTNSKYIMMVPKGSKFVTFRNKSDRSFVKKLNLPFQPRSGDAYNATYNLTLLTSSNRPSAVIINNDTLKIVGQAGFNIECNQPKQSLLYHEKNIEEQTCTAPDFGGSQISGHPIWLNSNTFAILDRSNRILHVYGIKKQGDTWKTYLKDTVKTNTSLHQVISYSKKSNIFYGMTEGNQNKSILARLYKFKYTDDRLEKINSRALITTLDGEKFKGLGGHNLYMTPNKKYLYAATGSGNVFVLKTSDLTIKTAFKAGIGAGHVNFMKNGKYGVVTNHQANYITVFNYKTHKFVKNIATDFEKEGIASLLHSHSPYIQGKYFYNFWTDGGVFYRVNLKTLKLNNYIYVGGIPIQGNYFRSID